MIQQGTAVLQDHSIGVIGGSVSNGFGGSMTIDQSVVTVRGNVNNGTACCAFLQYSECGDAYGSRKFQ